MMRMLTTTTVTALALALSAQAATLEANPADIAAVIGRAQPGDIIHLAKGVYPDLRLENLAFSTPVTITGAGAVLQGLSLHGVQGLTFSDLEFSAYCGAGKYPFVAYGSKSLRFEDLNIHGDTNCWAGLLLRESSDVVVTRSEFHHLGNGLGRLNTSNFTASNNRFHDISSDGINGGGGSNILIIGNHFTDFRPTNGAHPDAIQVWTTRTVGVATNIIVSGNIYVRGSGDVSTVAQGIFVTADSGARAGEPRLAKVKITGNVILGGMYNGITIQGADGAEVSDNTVAGFPDMESWIRAQDNTDLVISGNISQNYIYPSGKGGITERENRNIGAVTDGGARILDRRR